MPLPFEFIVAGRPASVNRTDKQKAWKGRVQRTARNVLKKQKKKVPIGGVSGLTQLKVFYFPHDARYTDIDNALKYTIDGLAAALLDNDKFITRIVTERFNSRALTPHVVPLHQAATLAKALDIAHPPSGALAQYATALKIEKYVGMGGAFW